MNLRHRAFTLVELVVSMGIGILVAMGAYTAFRTAAQTISIINRLGLENRLMRAGVAQALDDADWWTSFDQPEDPNKQPLRIVVERSGSNFTARAFTGDADAGGTIIAQSAAASASLEYGSTATEGALFTPFHRIPVWSDATDTVDSSVPSSPQLMSAVPWRIRPNDQLLEDHSALRDDDRVLWRDLDRGWDSERPHVAADPRTWFRGNLTEAAESDKRSGRYGLLSNYRRFPVLGFGDDPREVGGFARNGAIAHQVLTGPYGPYAGNVHESSRTFTWAAHQMRFLIDALGYYGALDYLPSNAIVSWHGGELRATGDLATNTYYGSSFASNLLSPDPPQPWCRVDERIHLLVGNLRGSNANIDRRRLQKGRLPLTGPWLTDTIVALPRSPYTGLYNIGYYWRDAGIDNDNGENPNTSLGYDRWAEHHRRRWFGEGSQPYHLAVLWNRVTEARPVTAQRPTSWPELQVLSARLLARGHFQHLCAVRWTDPQTGEVAELKFNALGTTLRGARQQRHRNQGWAAWYGPRDPRNDPTLDSPLP